MGKQVRHRQDPARRKEAQDESLQKGNLGPNVATRLVRNFQHRVYRTEMEI
jgi:hypothetical protein